MKRFCLGFFILLAGIGWCSVVSARQGRPYFFPYVSAYEATVMATPVSFQLRPPQEAPNRVFKVFPFPGRKIPEIFWYQNGLTCAIAAQKARAPMIVIIAGTGARYDSPRMTELQQAYYQAGFHVLSITSPTYSEFVINGSSSMMPGNLREDARDLYRVMQLAWAKVKDDVEVSEFLLTGYSLGGTQAAFVAMLDDQEKKFDFRRVLLINPAASLYNSVSRVDDMLLANVPGGIENFGNFIDDTLAKFAEAARSMGYVDLSGEYLYRLYRNFPQQDDFLASLIGFAFRFDSASMIFTADVMNGGGYVVPKGAKLTNSTSLTPYSMVLFRTGFGDYFKEYFFPYWQRRQPGLTMAGLIDELSLGAISAYLQGAKKIGLVHNEDDIILAPGEIEELEAIFGDRAQVYPIGGHLGNMNHPDVVRYMIEFFRGQKG